MTCARYFHEVLERRFGRMARGHECAAVFQKRRRKLSTVLVVLDDEDVDAGEVDRHRGRFAAHPLDPPGQSEFFTHSSYTAEEEKLAQKRIYQNSLRTCTDYIAAVKTMIHGARPFFARAVAMGAEAMPRRGRPLGFERLVAQPAQVVVIDSHNM